TNGPGSWSTFSSMSSVIGTNCRIEVSIHWVEPRQASQAERHGTKMTAFGHVAGNAECRRTPAAIHPKRFFFA
ncbi:MAG TPA: hypothetical protein VFI49_05030, partial [Rudaea sp.]|nr:hypothetical protein [Rudaea sp.]